MNRWTFINNDFAKEPDAQLSISDLSIQRGYGVFDYLKLIDNRPIFLKEHLQRFFHSASQMHLPVPHSSEALERIIQGLIVRNNLGTSGIRLTLTGGNSPDGYSIGSPNLLITQAPLRLPDTVSFEKGIRLATYTYQRTLPTIKSINYLMAVWLQPWLVERKADDVLYHLNGHISECPRANFFLVTSDNVVVTPDTGILKGISRQKLIAIAKDHYQIEERAISVEELRHCREAFITSTTKQVLPVVSIDDALINNGKAGPMAQALNKALLDLQHTY